MIIDCTSDLHGHYPTLEGGDLLIVAGDLTARDTGAEYIQFGLWLNKQLYRKKIVIAGNHDNMLQKTPLILDDSDPLNRCMPWSYLCDSGAEFEGLKVWGSPWTTEFEGMNPRCMAFTGEIDALNFEKFDLIPSDVDILVTHSPPFSILDKTADDLQVGSSSLMALHIQRLRPKLWVFGHIHESYGREGPYQWNNTLYVNASHVNERYEPVNKPIRVIL
jgi:Icc-related predicted phosphoesterase